MCTGHALQVVTRQADTQVHDGFLINPYILTDMLKTIATLLRLDLLYETLPVETNVNAVRTLSAAEMEMLLLTARIDHARGLSRHLDRIEEELDSPSQATSTQRRHLGDYDLPAIEKMLIRWMNL
jgi:hypothetical protein